MKRGPQAHYVRHNLANRIPRAHVYLDTEARNESNGPVEVQTFRCAVAAYDRRCHNSDGWREREWGQFADVESLWTWIDERCQARARTVLVAHNLGYDLRIADAFVQLPLRSWSLKAIRLDGGQAWCTWRNDRRTLVCVDTLSWVPTSLERLGELCEIPKLSLPSWDDDDDVWLARCRRDVEILADVWRRLVAWVRDDDLGNWKPTGAGQAWAAYRHRFMGHRLLVHTDDDARAAERMAASTGRCEVWRHGQLTGGPYTEWDYTTAYARIGVECQVPVALRGEISGVQLARYRFDRSAMAALVECEVTTDVPTVPCHDGGRWVWPVGTFSTTLWDCEVELARFEGATVVPSRAWLYRTAPALADFCGWVLDRLDPLFRGGDPVVAVALKHWSRALIGRTAAQWTRWEPFGRAPTADVSLGVWNDVDNGERFDILQAGHDVIRNTQTKENPDAMVAVMSWVMAECRRRLWLTMRDAGVDHVVYVDTDSIIVDPVGHARLSALRPAGMRVKGQWESIEVKGPRQLVLGRQLRAAGVPRGSRQVEGDTWEGEVWAGLGTSLRARRPNTVDVSARRFKVAGIDRRRQHDPDGMTSPFRLPTP